jgi:hypothetical protein
MSSDPKNIEQLTKDAIARNVEYEKYAGMDDVEIAKVKKEAEERKRLLKGRFDMQQSLRHVEVRRTLWRILEFSAPYQPSFDPVNPANTAHREGQRSVGLEIIKMIMDADSQAYLQMFNEHQSDLKVENERKRKESEEHDD